MASVDEVSNWEGDHTQPDGGASLAARVWCTYEFMG